MEFPGKVLLYKTKNGKTPITDFISSLERKPQTKVYNALNLLQTFGFAVGQPHVKKVTGTALWELRVVGSDNIRILYTSLIVNTFLCLHGFKKKKNKIPLREIKTAEDRLLEYRSRR